MRFKDYDNGTLLKAIDVPQAGWELTIAGFEERTFNDEAKPVVTFEEIEKGITLNKTRRRQLELMAAGADEMEALIGRKLVLFQTTALYQGEPVPSLQFRAVPEGAVQPQPAAAALTPPKPPKPPTPAAAAAPAAPA